MSHGTAKHMVEVSANGSGHSRWLGASLQPSLSPRCLFSSGWAFFVPYAVVYALGFGLAWTNATVRSLFWVCHLALLAAFVIVAFTALRARYGALLGVVRDPEFWFWALLCLGFILPGAYMEFPADPWEHFRRLHTWEPDAVLRHSPWVHRFAYFWGWTFFSMVPLPHQRLAADLYSAFWQILLAYQFYRFGFRLSGSRTWAKIHVIGAIALFGNNVFGFFRYYALASTMLAYVAYLAAAITVLDVLEARTPPRRAIPTLLATAGLMAFNHSQEVFLLTLFSAAAAFAVIWTRLSRRARLVIAGVALAGAVISLPLGQRAMADPAAFHLTPSRFYAPFISSFGVYRLWDTRSSYFQAMGVPGVVAALLGVVLWRSRLLVAVLALAPVVILMCPLIAIPLGQFAPRLEFTYRVLFLVPSSVILITALQAATRFIRRIPGRPERLAQAAAVALMLILGLYERPPVFGKLRFQYYRSPSLLEARYVDETAKWFAERRPPLPSCAVASDDVTEFVLGAYSGAPLRFDRVTGTPYPGWNWLPKSPKNVLELLDRAAAYYPCGYLVPHTSPAPWRRERSYYGALSRHWAADRADPMVGTPPGLWENAAWLLDRGWTRTFVPPFYWYYEPPAHAQRR